MLLFTLCLRELINVEVFLYTTVQKFGVGWEKMTVKSFMLQKISVSRKRWSFERSVNQRINY